MKIRKTLKKLSAIVMSFAMLFGILPMLGCGITAKAASNPVKMYFMDFTFSKYGITDRNIYIQVDAGSAANKAVYVHYENIHEGVWQDAQASFVTKLDANTEIWKANVHGTGLGEEYAIKYIGDGQTYWDNNNGNNYTNSDLLGEANVSAQRLRFGNNGYYLQVAVKNLAYNKIVKVRYTEDNWATYKDVDLQYKSAITGTNSELWDVTLNLDNASRDNFEFCVYYQVNGQTYWDNNFGSNYDISYYRAY